jgi:hypothetical protein
MPTKQEVREFIKSLRYPEFSAFCVIKLMVHFKVEEDTAIRMWNEREKIGDWSD